MMIMASQALMISGISMNHNFSFTSHKTTHHHIFQFQRFDPSGLRVNII